MSSNRDYREFDAGKVLDKLSNLATVNLHDYELAGENLARVVVSFTGDLNSDEFRVKLAERFSGLATPIKNSFRKLTANSAVGWISANRQVREYNEVEEGKRYRQLASNILMDKEDQSTWQLKATESGGKYLCRQGIEDLSEIAHAIHSRKVGIPLLASVVMEEEAAPKEFLAFVNKEECEVDYGYVVASEDKDGAGVVIKTVVSAITQEPVEVEAKYIIGAYDLEGQDTKAFGGKEVTADVQGDKAAMIAWYKKQYTYAPDYVNEIIKMINMHSFA